MEEEKEKMEGVGRKEAYTHRQRERGWDGGDGSGGEMGGEERETTRNNRFWNIPRKYFRRNNARHRLFW